MDDLSVQMIPASDLFPAVGLRSEDPALWTAANMAAGTLGITTSVLCERRHGMREGLLFEDLLSGSLGIAETLEITASDSITEDTLYTLLRNLERQLQAQVCHKSTPHIDVTCLHQVAIKD